MTNDIRTFFSGFMNIAQLSDWWGFMTPSFLNVVYPTAWYNGDALQQSDLGLVNLEYVVVGTVGVRQLRVRNNSCTSRYTFNGSNPGCFADFSSSAEDQSPYGPVNRATGTPSFTYSTAKQLGCVSACYFSGLYAVYPTSGFYQALPSAAGGNVSAAAAAGLLADLFAGRWLDRHTRAVFVELALYNVAANLLAAVTLSLELPAGGGVVPFIAVDTIRIENLFPTARASAGPLAAEALLFALLLGYTAQAAREWRAAGTAAYWAGAWAWVDWANFLLFFAAYIVRLAAFAAAAQIRFPPNPLEHASYAQAGSLVPPPPHV